MTVTRLFVAAIALATVCGAAALLAEQPADEAVPLIQADEKPYKRRPVQPDRGGYVFSLPPHRGF